MRNLGIFGLVLALLIGAGVLIGQGGRPAGSVVGPSTVNVMDYGASPAASAAANTTAFGLAVDAMQAGDTLLIPAGTWVFNTFVFDPPSHCRLDCRGVLAPVHTGAQTAITIGVEDGSEYRSFYTIRGLYVVPSGTSYPWKKDFVGVRVINCMYSDIWVELIEDCWVGFQATGTDSKMNMYNTFRINKIIDCYRCVHVAANQGGSAGGLGLVDDSFWIGGKLLVGTLTGKPAFTIEYVVGGAETCTMDIAANVFQTTASAGTSFNLDLTDPLYDTLGELIAVIHADASYTATIHADAETHWLTIDLLDVAAVDIALTPTIVETHGQTGNVGLLLAHDATNTPSRHLFENFYFATGEFTTGFQLAGGSNYLRAAFPLTGSLRDLVFTADSAGNVAEMALAATALLTDSGTGNQTPQIAERLKTSTWALPGTVNANADHNVFTAPNAGTILRIDLISTTDVAAHDVNFWTVQVENTTTANDLLAAGQLTTAAGAGGATANQAWSITPDQNQTVSAGDVLQVQWVKAAAAPDWTNTTVIVHVQLANN